MGLSATAELFVNLCSLCCIMQTMEFCDTERWNPMMDDFYNESFNRYGLAATDSGTTVRLFIGGIPACLTEQGLRNLVSPIATIRQIALIAHKNIAFVSLLQKDALKVITHFDNYKLGDNYLTVRLSKSKRPTDNEQRGAASGTAGGDEEQKKKKTSYSSFTRLFNELKVPASAYPTAAKYVQIGEEHVVKVLSVASPSQFWICCDSCDANERLTELETKMQDHYSRLALRTGFRPNGSGLYAAPKRDSGEWCRVQELSFDTESVSVLLLDYGTHDQVSLTKLHSLEGSFLSLPFQAICCSLSHIQGSPWSEEAVSCMCQLLSNVQQVRAKVCDIEGYNLGVQLILPSGQTVNDVLVSRNYANYVDGFEPNSVHANTQSVAESITGPDVAESSEDNAVYYTTVNDLNFMPLSVGEQYDVVVLHARNTSDITVCQKDNVGELRTLIVELNRYQQSDSFSPRVREIVAACYAADGSWYRAEVLSLDDNSATVRFIDFGNTAKVNIKSMVQLQPRHVEFPVYSANVMFRGSSVDNELLSEYSSLMLKVVEQRGTSYVVSLVEDDTAPHLASDPASQRAYLASDIKRCCLDTGKTYKVWVTDSTDVENFYVQLSEMYLLIDEQLQSIYFGRSGGHEPQKIGELVALHLETDDAWYRAVVTEVGNSKAVKCQMIDFGISVTTTNKCISQFDSQLLTYPLAAFKCSFRDAVVSSVGLWKGEYLKPMTAVYDMTVVEIENDLHFVELTDVESGVDMKQTLIEKGLIKARSSRLPSVESPAVRDKSSELSCEVVQSESLLASLSDTEVCRSLSMEKIRIVHANNPTSFYIQSGSDSVQKKLGSLNQSITNFCSQSSHRPDTVVIGQIVGVMHDDGLWYRGEIVDSGSSGKFRVHFVDYGITKTADSAELRPLPDSLAVSLPRQAIHCAIDRVAGCEPDGSWTLATVKCFKNICENCDFVLKSIYKVDSDSIWLVDLIHLATGRTAKDMLLDHHLAMKKTSVSSKNSRSVSKCSPVVPDVGGTQVRCRTSPPLLSSTVKNAILQAGDTVLCTCVHSPSSFFVQQQQHQSNVEVLQKELKSHCETCDLQYSPKQVGELVAVMHNNCWYRAEVLSFDVVSAKLFCIDYGNTVDSVNVRDIRALPLHFATALPKLAIPCALGGVCGTCKDGSFSEEAGTWFRDSYLQVACIVTKVKYTGPSAASLVSLKKLNSDKTARQSLLDYGMALVSTGAVPNSTSSSLTCSSQVHVPEQFDRPRNIEQPCAKATPNVSTGRRHFADAATLQLDATVSVVHVVSPADFYVILSDAAALQGMMSLSQKLEKYCITSAHVGYIPQYVGEPVAAKFEGQWYRAEVVKLMFGNRFEVFFVDFGNTAVVDAVDLHSLREEFVKWPKQAVHCGIDRICGTGDGRRFTEASTEWFKEKFACGSNATLSSVRVVSGKHMVNLSVTDDRAGAMELLVSAEFARYSDL